MPGLAPSPWTQLGCLHHQPFFLAQAWAAWLPEGACVDLSTYLWALVPEGITGSGRGPLSFLRATGHGIMSLPSGCWLRFSTLSPWYWFPRRGFSRCTWVSGLNSYCHPIHQTLAVTSRVHHLHLGPLWHSCQVAHKWL